MKATKKVDKAESIYVVRDKVLNQYIKIHSGSMGWTMGCYSAFKKGVTEGYNYVLTSNKFAARFYTTKSGAEKLLKYHEDLEIVKLA